MGERRLGARREPFYVGPEELAVHLCVLGQSGMGKSKFLEQLMRYLLVSGCGFALIDPHGDLSEDVLAYLAYRKAAKQDDSLIARTHYLEPSFEQVFHYDPFRFRPRTPLDARDREAAVRSWLDAKADRFGEIVQRKQGDADFQGMARLQRNLKNILTAVGTSIDATGRHLPLADALVLLDIEHPRHEEVFQLVAPHLDDNVLSDFRRLRGYRRAEDRLRETESTINRMRSLLSPLVRSIFSDQVATIDFASIIERQEALLVNLKETDYFSADQSTAIGGMFIHEILSAAQNAPREQRRPFYLIIDEAAEFIGADIQRALGVMRKFQLSICLAAQDLMSFKKGDLDLRPKVLSQCGTIISFRQSWPEDVDILARVMASGNLDFTKYQQVVDRPDGYEFVPMKEYSKSFTWSDSTQDSFGLQASRSTGIDRSHSATQGSGTSESLGFETGWSQQDSSSFSRSTTDGGSRGTVRGQSRQQGSSESRSPTGRLTEGINAGATDSLNSSQLQNWSASHASSDGHSESNSVSESRSHSRSRNQSESHGTSSSESISEGFSVQTSEGSTEARSKSVSYKKVPLAKTREEIFETPHLLNSVADQFERIKAAFTVLGTSEGIAKLRNQPQAFPFRSACVEDKWPATQKFEAIRRVRQRIVEQHAYNARPQIGPVAQDERLDRFLRTKQKPEADDGQQLGKSSPPDEQGPFL